MNVLRKSLAVTVSAALVWVGVAGGVLSAPSGSVLSPAYTVSAHYHQGSTTADGTGHRDNHAGLGGTSYEKHRACAKVCLGSLAAKLVPTLAHLTPPHFVVLPVSRDDFSVSLQTASALRVYWPTAPPDGGAAKRTGAARTLAYNSHLRI